MLLPQGADRPSTVPRGSRGSAADPGAIVRAHRAARARGLLGAELDRDVDDLVLLPADQAPFAAAQQDLRARDAVAIRGAVRVPQEARVHPGVPHDQAHAVEHALAVHDRAHHLLRHVEDRERVDARPDAETIEDRGQRLRRRVARPRAERAGARVDLRRAGADREHGVRHAEREVLVGVEPHLGVVAELGDERGHALVDLVEDEGTSRVDDVDALAPGVGHDPCLGREDLGRLAVAHHQEPDRLEPEVAGDREVLARDVGFGAVGRDAHDRDADVADRADVVHRPDAGEHQRRDARTTAGGLHRAAHELALVDGREPVVVRRTRQPVTMADLDDRDAGARQPVDHAAHVVDREAVLLGVRTVAQRGVGDAHVEVVGVRHLSAPRR